MAIRTSFFNDGQTVYQAGDFMALNKAAITNGVIGPGDLLVKPVSPAAMQVAISMGTLHKDGHTVVMDADTTVDITANTSGYNRIDAIVIEVDDTTNTTTAKAVAGTPSSSPARPTLTSKQEVLAYVTVGNNASVINANAISDARKQAATRLATNHNLLINGGFKVCQELPGPYVARNGVYADYTVDQWICYGIGTMTRRDAGGVDLTGASDLYLIQPIELSSLDRSKPHTVSVEASTTATSGTNRIVVGIGFKNRMTGSFIYSSNTPSKALTNGRTTYSFTADFLDDYEADYLVVFIVINGEATVYNAKLEQGSVATPYVPEDPAVELLRCMRYYWRPKSEILSHTMGSTDSIWVNVGLVFPVQMRVAPTTTCYEPGNIDYPSNPNNYKFGAENWGAPNHIWWVGDSDRSHYVSVQGASIRNDGLVLLQISSGTGNASSTYSFHAEFDARIR